MSLADAATTYVKRVRVATASVTGGGLAKVPVVGDEISVECSSQQA